MKSKIIIILGSILGAIGIGGIITSVVLLTTQNKSIKYSNEYSFDTISHEIITQYILKDEIKGKVIINDFGVVNISFNKEEKIKSYGFQHSIVNNDIKLIRIEITRISNKLIKLNLENLFPINIKFDVKLY